MSLKQNGCEGDHSSDNKTIKLSRDRSMGRLPHWPKLRIFLMLNSLFANYSIVNRSIVITLTLLLVCSVKKVIQSNY